MIDAASAKLVGINVFSIVPLLSFISFLRPEMLK
jgi:hypothetical protein